MTQQEIIEGNKLIRKFHTGAHIEGDWVQIIGSGSMHVSLLDYHKSWNSLMQVLEKIEKYLIDKGGKNSNIQINTLSMAIEFTDKAKPEIDYYDQYKIESFESKIAMVFCAVVDFITWFNSLSK